MKTIEKKAVPDRQLGPLEYLSVEEGGEYSPSSMASKKKWRVKMGNDKLMRIQDRGEDDE